MKMLRLVVIALIVGLIAISFVGVARNTNATSPCTATAQLEISPTEGVVGTTVTVKGLYFNKNEGLIELRYYSDGGYMTVADGITANGDGSWESIFKISASSKGSHKIDAMGEYNSLTQVRDAIFIVKPGISLSKSSGSIGDNIAVSGSGFVGSETGIRITYDGTLLGSSTEANDSGSWTISFSVPPSTPGLHHIDAWGWSTPAIEVSDQEFAVSVSASATPAIALEPSSGQTDTKLSVSGTGFAGKKMVTVSYDGVERGSATTDDKGNFSGIIFPAPQSIGGKHTVTAADAEGNKANADFIMQSQSQPPTALTPVLQSPLPGSRVGFLGSVSPTFQWSPVMDQNVVAYSLQIATNAGFAIPSLSLTGLSQATYTLTKQQALPHGTYYWRVKATDGAGYEGSWTSPYFFKVALFSLWQFIIMIVLAIALIGVLVHATRRSYYC